MFHTLNTNKQEYVMSPSQNIYIKWIGENPYGNGQRWAYEYLGEHHKTRQIVKKRGTATAVCYVQAYAHVLESCLADNPRFQLTECYQMLHDNLEEQQWLNLLMGEEEEKRYGLWKVNLAIIIAIIAVIAMILYVTNNFNEY